MKKTVYIVIGCDTDPDRARFIEDIPTNTFSWRGMLEGIPILKATVQDIKDDNGNSPIFTWCLRADHQIKEIYGSYNYILETNKSFLLELEKCGDEIAWHPHFFRKDNKDGIWYQEYNDIDWQVKMLEEAYRSFISTFPARAKSVRMGWDYHNNKTFSKLNELGVEVDFSGIPGLYILPKNKSVKSVNFFDWSLSPNNPYYPSVKDYRRPANKNEESYNTLESPNYVSQSFLWSLISGVVFAKKMKNFRQIFRAIRKPVYWIGITGKTKLFSPIIDQLSRELKYKDDLYFITYFHPDEVIPNNSSLYSLQNLYDNLKMLKIIVNHYGANIRFIKASDLKHYF